MRLMTGLVDARAALQEIHLSRRKIGSVHTLGALHVGHAKVIRQSACENDATFVTIYPNPAQLAPGTNYEFDRDADAKAAFAAGATHVLVANTNEMYPTDYATFLDQGERYAKMDGTIVPYLFKGMITQSIRWILFTQPHRTYWGMKDIGQTLLVERAVTDLLLNVVVRRVPCVRTRAGIPVSSRLMRCRKEDLDDARLLYKALHTGRECAKSSSVSRRDITTAMQNAIHSVGMRHFRLRYIDVFDPNTFDHLETVKPPFILHGVISDDKINHFDGLLIESENDLLNGPAVCWVDDLDFPKELQVLS
jgi:pantoate--beta-alanine ligase